MQDREERAITRDRWQHVEALYHAALAVGDHERPTFLRAACGGDESLREEVQSLLEYATDAQAFMVEPAIEIVGLTSPEQPATPIAGKRLGSYEIGPLLGSGGMGDVYRARDITLGRDVAVKILPDVFTADAERRARFEREARLLAALNHPHIGAIYGFERREGLHALVLELVEGQTLAERLKAGPLPVRETLAIARQVAGALEAAHDKGIVHRDLKPSNIMITPDGAVKVLDFGLAKEGIEESAASDTDETRDGLILGTAAYMSPEQARGRRADKRTDIWSFGCVVWAMLTGRPPFAGDTASDTIAAILDREPAWDALPPSTPAHVRRLLQRCLEKNPKDRLRDIGDAQLEIDDHVSEQISLSSGRWREGVGWSAIGVCMLTALVLGGYAISRTPRPAHVARFHVLLPEGEGVRDLALSADGRRLAFVGWSRDGRRRLWVRDTDSLEAHALDGTDGARWPFWSADGRFIGFFSQGKLRKIAADGGAPQVISDAGEGRGGTWNASGTILFAPFPNGGLYQVLANGGAATPVTRRRDGETGHVFPQFLPDGRRFLFLAQAGQGTPSGIYLSSLGSSETVFVLDSDVQAQYVRPGYLLFVRGSALMAQAFDAVAARRSGEVVSVADDVWYDTGGGSADFGVTEGVLLYRGRKSNLGELIWVDRTGQPLGKAGPRGDYIHPWLSPDARRAVVEVIDPDTQAHSVWMLDLARGTGSAFATGHPQSHFPVWSPDGRTILFSSNRDGPWALFRKPSEGTGADEELLESAANTVAIDWSRDGRYILYQTSHPSTQADVWALPIEPRAQPFAVANTRSDERQAQLSPEGRWVAYASDTGGRQDVWVQAFPKATERWAVSTSGGSQPQWRRDGRELFYISGDRKLMAVDVNAASSSFNAGVPRELFPLPLSGGLSARNNYMPTADGKRFLVNASYAGVGTRVAVVLDWAAVMHDR